MRYKKGLLLTALILAVLLSQAICAEATPGCEARPVAEINIKIPASVDDLRGISKMLIKLEDNSVVRISFQAHMQSPFVKDDDPGEQDWVGYFSDMNTKDLFKEQGYGADGLDDTYRCNRVALPVIKCPKGTSLDPEKDGGYFPSECLDQLFIEPESGEEVFTTGNKLIQHAGLYKFDYLGGAMMGQSTFRARPLPGCK